MKLDERAKAAIVIVIVLIIFLEIFGRNKVPHEFSDFVEKVSSQKILMNKIGGYETFEISYNELELQKDSMSLEIIIYGKEENLIYKGYVKKSLSKWDLTTLKPTLTKK